MMADIMKKIRIKEQYPSFSLKVLPSISQATNQMTPNE
jgi:hypothetical protein